MAHSTEEAVIESEAPTHWLKCYEEAVIESEARTAVVQSKSEA